MVESNFMFCPMYLGKGAGTLAGWESGTRRRWCLKQGVALKKGVGRRSSGDERPLVACLLQKIFAELLERDDRITVRLFSFVPVTLRDDGLATPGVHRRVDEFESESFAMYLMTISGRASSAAGVLLVPSTSSFLVSMTMPERAIAKAALPGEHVPCRGA
jgi:hypothetical protein